MVQFVVQSILEGGVYLLALFGFYGYVRPHSKAWITRRIRGLGVWLSERKPVTKCALWVMIIGVTVGLFVASRMASWQQIFDNPLQREAIALSDFLDARIKKWKAMPEDLGASAAHIEMANELGNWVFRVRRQLREHGQWSDALDDMLNRPAFPESLDDMDAMSQEIRRLAKRL